LFRKPLLDRTFYGVVLLPLVLAGCRSRQQDPRALLEQKAAAARQAAQSQVSNFGDVRSTNAKYLGYDSKGRPLWEVGAKNARAQNEKTVNGKKIPFTVTLDGATARLFRDGKPETTFRAQRIVLTKPATGAILVLTGGVQLSVPAARLANGKTGAFAARGPVAMTAPETRVDITKRRMFCARGATMTQGQTRVVSTVLAADTNLGVAQLSNPKAAAPEGRFSAKSAVWNWQAARVQATGSVRAEREGTTISGAKLDADTNASRGTVSGGISAQTKDGKASAQRANFDWQRGTLIASGDVRLEKDGGILQAATVQTDKNLNGAVASGGVRLAKDGATLSARTISGYDKLSRAVATGGVTLVQDGATVTAPRVEAWLDAKRAVASGGVRLRRADLDVSAARVESTNLGEATQRVNATGGVRARNESGAVAARRVSWGGGRVVALGDVTMRKGANTLGGDRLDADDKFETARLSGTIRGTAQGANLSAKSVVWRANAGNRDDGGQVLASGGVRARWKNAVVRAVTLEAAGNGKSAVARGGVVVTSDDGAIIKAKEARYNRAANTVLAPGDVYFFDPQRGEQRGQNLVYNLETKTATLRNVTGNIQTGPDFSKKLFQ
jgi:hypothetical protein